MPLRLRRAKYGNRAVVHDGRRFASRAEGARYLVLKTLETLGQIKDLRCQVRYPLVVNGVKVCAYVADFVYVDLVAECREVVEDCKGYRTPEYKLKKKLLKALHGIEIAETR